jgi:general secretion pathway protein F
MALYDYTALNSSNESQAGIMDEADRNSVARRLLQQGLRPLEIKKHKHSQTSSLSFAGLRDKFQTKRITKADVEFFTKQLTLLLNAGLSLDASLRIMKAQSRKPVFRQFTGEIEQKLKEGKSFSEALAEQPIFSSMYVNVAKAGEEGGILPAMLTKISEYQATFQELKQFIISASIYPLILLIVGLVAIIILVTAILPRFEILFSGMGHDLPANVKVMMSVAHFITNHYLWALLLVIVPPVALYKYLQTAEGQQKYDHLAIRLPLLAGFTRDLETTRIFRTLEVLVNNGVHLATALRITSGVAVNSEYRKALNRATEALKEGQQVGQKLKAEGLLPDLAVDLLSIGEESGRVGEVCGQIAEHFEVELRMRIKRIIAMLEPALILFIALIAGYVVVSMLSVIMSINDIAG